MTQWVRNGLDCARNRSTPKDIVHPENATQSLIDIQSASEPNQHFGERLSPGRSEACSRSGDLEQILDHPRSHLNAALENFQTAGGAFRAELVSQHGSSPKVTLSSDERSLARRQLFRETVRTHYCQLYRGAQ